MTMSSSRRQVGKTAFLTDAWYKQSPWLKTLRPLSSLFQFLAKKKRRDFLSGNKTALELPVPVIVVGNITVGGTGKTPLVIAIIAFLKSQGYKPGVVSRGYTSKAPHYPYTVTKESDPNHSGDEPLLIATRCQCPVVIDPNRVSAAKKLIDEYSCDVIVSDDGLQHYNLSRQFEICVIDGQRGLGNRKCLPEGPLREPVARLDDVDVVVVNGESSDAYAQEQFEMKLVPGALQPLHVEAIATNIQQALPQPGDAVNAVAGIGNPERFFNLLEHHGYIVAARAFADHHHYRQEDFIFSNVSPVLMTEKDAVKCGMLSLKNAWFLPVEAQLPEKFWQQLLIVLKINNVNNEDGE